MTHLMYNSDKCGRQRNIVVGQMSGQTNIGHTNIGHTNIGHTFINQTNIGRTKLGALFQVTSVLCLTVCEGIIVHFGTQISIKNF
jgi:hypothetical protein